MKIDEGEIFAGQFDQLLFKHEICRGRARRGQIVCQGFNPDVFVTDLTPGIVALKGKSSRSQDPSFHAFAPVHLFRFGVLCSQHIIDEGLYGFALHFNAIVEPFAVGNRCFPHIANGINASGHLMLHIGPGFSRHTGIDHLTFVP